MKWSDEKIAKQLSDVSFEGITTTQAQALVELARDDTRRETIKEAYAAACEICEQGNRPNLLGGMWFHDSQRLCYANCLRQCFENA